MSRTVKYGVTHLLHWTIKDFGEVLKKHATPFIQCSRSRDNEKEELNVLVRLSFRQFKVNYKLNAIVYKDRLVSDEMRESLLFVTADGKNIDMSRKLQEERERNYRLRYKEGRMVENNPIEQVILNYIEANHPSENVVKSANRARGKWNYANMVGSFQNASSLAVIAQLTIDGESNVEDTLFKVQADLGKTTDGCLFSLGKWDTSGNTESLFLYNLRKVFEKHKKQQARA